VKIATISNAAVGHTGRWVEWFRGRGHDVQVWSLEPGPAGLGARALPSASLPGALRYPLAAPALRKELAAFGPDVVDSHFVPNYGLLAALAGRHPLSVTAWGSDLLITAPSHALQRARARFVLERADLVLADAENLALAARRLGAPAERVHAVPWGISRARFGPRGPRTAGLLVGTRMHEPVYDVATLIRGVAPLFARHPQLRLELAGDGSLRQDLEELAAQLLPAGRFAFLGRLDADAMAAKLAAADVYLSASLSDSTSVSLLEAMASGALPVVSDLPGNREWVGEGEGAWLFAPGDAAGVGAALERAFGDPLAAEAARARNAAVIAERGDEAVQMAKIERLFLDLVTAGARTRTAGGAR